ncbi:MAG: plasma-membrane proton-efflux P-type ATPase [Candidatus Micrarchaeia archaeon]
MAIDTKATSDFEKMSAAGAFAALQSGKNGLSAAEAGKRAAEIGYNEVTEKKTSPVLEFLSHFWGPIPWLLEFAAIACYFIGNRIDAVVLGMIVVVNGAVAYYNEHDSKKALELLKKKLSLRTRVLRGGSWSNLDARELVPGDVITIGLGDVVPADAKILEGNVSADQSALTGESLPAELAESGILFTGSTIKRGEAKCIVINTGMRTYFGKTVELVNIAKPKSKTEEIMFTIARNVGYLGAALFAVVLVYAMMIGSPLITIFTFAVLFIGGGIPAALPMMFTIAQSKGATDLSKKGILVTKLDSIENAASVEVICLDKTGTLTMNELEVADAIPLGKCNKGELLALCALASSEASKDAIDQVVLQYAKKNGAAMAGLKQLSYTPFEPSTKRAEGLVQGKGKKFRAIKGAPQMVMSLCKGVDRKMKAAVEAKINALSLKGCRVLAIAKSSGAGKADSLTLCGLIALADPIRKDSSETIAALKEAGIKPIMLTGDNIAVAREIAKKAGIGERVVRIGEIKSLPENKQADAVLACDGIAEIYPEDKYWVVKLLQSRGKMVGMTGDGVNDAPALKQAELGIAVSNSADVAKAAASMVLTEPGTRAILDSVRVSRETFQRMLTWTLKKIARSVQFMLILMLGFFWFHDIVVSITGLVFLMIVNDFLTMSLAVDNTRASRRPNLWDLKGISLASAFIGLLFFAIEVAVFFAGVRYFGLDLSGMQTLMLLSLVYTGQMGIYIVRERGRMWESWPNSGVALTLWGAIAIFTALAIFGVGMDALPAGEVLITFALCAAAIFLSDFPKLWAYRKLGI